MSCLASPNGNGTDEDSYHSRQAALNNHSVKRRSCKVIKDDNAIGLPDHDEG